MAYDTTFPHLCQALANKRVLVGVQFDVVVDRLVDEIATRTVLRGSQRIKGVDLLGVGAKADGFLGSSHNTWIISCIILYYKGSSHWKDWMAQTPTHSQKARMCGAPGAVRRWPPPSPVAR